MAVRSRRLWGPTALTVGAFQTLYTVPAERTAIIHGLYVTNGGSTTAWPVSLRVNGIGVIAELVIQPKTYEVLDDVILNPGDVLTGRSNAAGVAGMWCHGFGSLLLGAPE